MQRIILLLTILLILQRIECKKKTRHIYFWTTKSGMNQKYMHNFVTSINPHNSSVNILMDLSRNLTDIWGTVAVSLWLKQNQFRQIISYDVDICQYLQHFKPEKTNLLNAYIVNFYKYTNLTKTCPIEKNYYQVLNYKPDKESIPPFIPTGKFRITVLIYRKKNGSKESIGNCEFSVELK